MSLNKIKYSIIIPTFNEEEIIKRLMIDLDEQVKGLEFDVEIIIVDGSSTDGTVDICSKYNVKILCSLRGRGEQLVKGAEIAKGEYLFFLHADSILPVKVLTYINKEFDKNTEVATFRMKFDRDNLLYKLYSFFTRFDSIFSTFGDQGVIIRKSFYDKLGGFRNLSIMEDVEFLRKAREVTKNKKLNNYIITSSRKFENEGIIKTQIKSFILIIRYLLGTNTQSLYNLYYNREHEQNKSSNHFRKISGAGQSQNKIGLNNK